MPSMPVRPRRTPLLAAAVGLMLVPGGALAQSEEPGRPTASSPRARLAADRAAAEERTRTALNAGLEFLLSAQEGDGGAEWPYEGVYRVRGQIPIGYRVGGTAITGTTLLRAPGYGADEARQGAVRRAVAFVCKGIEHPLMSEEKYDGGYDVRGWGYTYGLAFLLELKSAGAVPADLADQAEGAIGFYLNAIQKTEVPRAGGWNYARQPGRDAVSPSSPFMTSATLQALFEAKRQGYEVDAGVVERALRALERSRLPSGSIVYSGDAGGRARDGVPGAVGRMLITETTLALAGRSTPAQVRGAIDAFITHWDWLDQRRAQPGTHVPPYGVAPYYFYFAHHAAAQAVELLPEHERGEYRRRITDLLFSVRQENGTWNDRVFPRSASYGTSMALLALLMPGAPAPARWEAGSPDGAVSGSTVPAVPGAPGGGDSAPAAR